MHENWLLECKFSFLNSVAALNYAIHEVVAKALTLLCVFSFLYSNMTFVWFFLTCHPYRCSPMSHSIFACLSPLVFSVTNSENMVFFLILQLYCSMGSTAQHHLHSIGAGVVKSELYTGLEHL